MKTKDKVKMRAEDAQRLVMEALETLGDEAMKRRESGADTTDKEGAAAWSKSGTRRGSHGYAERGSLGKRGSQAGAEADLKTGFTPFCEKNTACGMCGRASTTRHKRKDCRRILEAAFSNSPSSYSKGRAVLSSIFNYGIRMDWCSENPVTHIETPKVKEQTIVPLSTEDVQRLLQEARKPQHRCMDFSASTHAVLRYSPLGSKEIDRA